MMLQCTASAGSPSPYPTLQPRMRWT